MSNGARPNVWARPLLVWMWLVLLAIGSVGSAYVPLGPFNTAINLGVAGIMIVVLWLFLMELMWSHTIIRLIAVAGFLWLAFMFALIFADYFSRS